MRKYLLKITAALMVIVMAAGFCVSCQKQNETGKNKATEQLNKGFECTAAVTWNNQNYVVQLSRSAPGLCVMTFMKPDELKSLGFELGEQGFKVRYDGIEASVDPSSLPQTALFNAILGAMDAGSRPADVKVTMKGDNNYVMGSTQAGKFKITLDRSFMPVTLEFTDLKLIVKFEQFKFDK